MASTNPFIDGTPYATVTIGGATVPGRLQSVEGLEAEQDWNFQKSAGGASKGAAPAAATPPQTGNIRVATPPAPAATGGGNSAGSFGTSVWRGAKLAETITIKTRITNADEHDAAIAFMTILMPKRGQKPPTLSLVYPRANDIGINRCSIRKISSPEEKTAGKFDYEFTVVVCEVNPQKTAAAGTADPAKPPDAPTPQNAQEVELQKLMKKAAEP